MKNLEIFSGRYNGGPLYRRLLASDPTTWPSLSVDLREWAPYDESYETELRPDHFISVILREPFANEYLLNGAWKREVFVPGTALILPKGEGLKTRYGLNGNKVVNTLSLYLPDSTIEEVRGELPLSIQVIDAVLHPSMVSDPIFETIGRSLLRAFTAGAPDFYAQASANWLAGYLLLGSRKVHTWHRALSREHIADYRLRRVMEYIEANVANKLDLTVLSREAGISKFHFSTLFSKAFGTTVRKHVQSFRMQVAKTMLVSTEKTVLDIALSTGYRSAAHFGAMFRQHCGQTPTEYRATHSDFQSGEPR